ncbi:MFS transporter [Actinoallomurus iriomotensis]|uniref:MFS transporter n=1 Tax=Actinoallomurus iriomotensis TaxID=478107 RepID=A0A9W6RU83_9ACTN|nr:MFS transporter [Actinoallomurus iriomotensis]GLY80247.1 hypothetical protein Airi01_085140 [Actinoallomurus iriomotensis]GLY88220.1 hypothetical protein Airi02_061490 [Actinoallomurus iriomotensis]
MSAGARSARTAFRLLLWARTISALSDFMVPAALAIAIVDRGGTPGELGLVLACALVPKVVLLPFGGALADRFDARRAAIAADAVRVVTQALIALELTASSPDVAVIAGAQVVAGSAAACSLPTTWPLLIAVVPPPERQRANSLLSIGRSVALLLGPTIAGTLILTTGPAAVFVIDASAFAAGAALLSRVRTGRTGHAGRSLWADLRAGWAEVRARDWYWTSLVAHASWNFASGVLVTIGPSVVIHRMGGRTVWVVLLQAGGIGLLAGSALATRVRLRRPVLTGNLGFCVYAAPLLLLAAGATAPVVIGAYGVAMALAGLMDPIWDSTVQALMPEHVLARVTAYELVLSLGAQPLGVALAPTLAAATGPGVPLVATAAIVAATCAGTAAVPGVRRLRVDAL